MRRPATTLLAHLTIAALLLALAGCAGGTTPAPTASPTSMVLSPTSAAIASPTSTIAVDLAATIARTTAAAPPETTPAPMRATATRPGTASPATPTPAAEVRVGPGGVATIGAALATVAPGGTVRVAAGTYREQVTVLAPVTIVPAGDGPVWLDAECQRAHGLRIAAPDVTVRGLGVANTVDAGVLIDGQQLGAAVARVTLAGLTIRDFDCRDQGPEYRAGIGVWYAGPGQRLLDNTIVRRVALPGGLAGGKSNGIWFKSNSNHPSGGGHLLAGNRIAGVYDGIGGEKEDDPRGGFDRDTLIAANAITDCDDDGISVEGGTANVRVQDNTIARCAVGLANAPNLTGPVYFERNRITDGRPGYYGVVQCFKIGDRGHGVAYYTGNDCTLGPGASGWAQSNPGVNPIVARDNHIAVGRYVIEINSPVEPGTSFDGNCLSTTDPERFVAWGDGHYGDLAAFRRGTGQEGRGCGGET